jgi:hypothetical protein
MEYLSFDTQRNHGLNQRLAAQIAFGRESQKLDAALLAAESDVGKELSEFVTVEEDILTGLGAPAMRPGIMSMVEKALRAHYVKKLGGEKGRAEYTRLKQLRERALQIDETRKALITLFQRNEDPWSFASALGGFLANGALQQFGSALNQLAELLSPILGFGVSKATAGQVARGIRFLGEDFLGSIMEAMRLGRFVPPSEDRAALLRVIGSDPRAERTLRDAFEGEFGGGLRGAAARLLRSVPAIQGLSPSRISS